jgi:hypothetical protein
VAVFLLFPIPFPIRSAQDCPNCPRHQQHNTPKQTGKKRKKEKRKTKNKLKMHRVGQTLRQSCLSAIASQSITIGKLKEEY